MASNPLFDNEKDLLSTEEFNSGLGSEVEAAIQHSKTQQIHITNEEREKWNAGLSQKQKNASKFEDGLMSKQDKAKLDLVEAQANNYSHPISGVLAGTYCNVTVDAQGHVLRGETMAPDASKLGGEEPSAFARINSPLFTGTPRLSETPNGEDLRDIVNVDFVKNSAVNRVVLEGNVSPDNHYRMWLDTSTTPNVLKYYSDALSAWVALSEAEGTAAATSSTGSPIAIASYEPDFTYDLWYNTLNHSLYRKEQIGEEEVVVEEENNTTPEYNQEDPLYNPEENQEPVEEEPTVITDPDDPNYDQEAYEQWLEDQMNQETTDTEDEQDNTPTTKIVPVYAWVQFKYYHVGIDMPETDNVIWYDPDENELRVNDGDKWMTIPFISYQASEDAPPVDCLWMDPVTNELKYKLNDEWIPYLGNQVRRYIKGVDVIDDFIPRTPCMYGELEGNNINNIFMKDVDGKLAFYKEKAPFVKDIKGDLNQFKIDTVNKELYYPVAYAPQEIEQYRDKVEEIDEVTKDFLFTAEASKIYVLYNDAYMITSSTKIAQKEIVVVLESANDILTYMTTDNAQVLNTLFILKENDALKCWTVEQVIPEDGGDAYFIKRSHDNVITLDKDDLLYDRNSYEDEVYPYKIYYYDEENQVLYEKKNSITKFSAIAGKGVTLVNTEAGLDEAYKDDIIICVEDNKVFQYVVSQYEKIGKQKETYITLTGTASPGESSIGINNDGRFDGKEIDIFAFNIWGIDENNGNAYTNSNLGYSINLALKSILLKNQASDPIQYKINLIVKESE